MAMRNLLRQTVGTLRQLATTSPTVLRVLIGTAGIGSVAAAVATLNQTTNKPPTSDLHRKMESSGEKMESFSPSSQPAAARKIPPLPYHVTPIGGYCGDIDVDEVLEKARFAVNKINKEKNLQLQLVRVVDVSKYNGQGTCYNLTLEVKDPTPMFYRALVVKKLDGNLSLVRFFPGDVDYDPHPNHKYRYGPSTVIEGRNRLYNEMAELAYKKEEEVNRKLLEAHSGTSREIKSTQGVRGTLYGGA